MKGILSLSEKLFGNNVEEPTDFFWVALEECPEVDVEYIHKGYFVFQNLFRKALVHHFSQFGVLKNIKCKVCTSCYGICIVWSRMSLLLCSKETTILEI